MDTIRNRVSSFSPYHLQMQYAAYFGGGSSKMKSVDPLAGLGVRELYQQLNEMLGPQMGQGVSPYPGQMVPGTSPLQEMGFDVAQGLTPMASGGQQYFQDVLGATDPSAPGRFQGMAEGGLQDVMTPWDPKSGREFWETSIKAPTMETWQRDVIPTIKEHYAGQNAADSGAMNRALARSGETLSTNLGAQLGNIQFQGEQAHQGRQQTGINQAMNLATLPGNVLGQAGQVGGMGGDFLNQLLNIGGQQRGITGEQLQEPYQKWQFEQPWNNPYLQNYLQMGLDQPGVTPYMSQSAPGLGSQMLPMLGSFFGSPAGSQMGVDMLGELLPAAGGLLGGLGGAAGGMAGLAALI